MQRTYLYIEKILVINLCSNKDFHTKMSFQKIDNPNIIHSNKTSKFSIYLFSFFQRKSTGKLP